jgi:effector-binding domain-containing protein
MSWLRTAALVLVIALVALVAIAFLLPREVHVEREIHIDAPAATVHTLLNGYRRFHEWSPWADLDPNAKYVITGPDQGIGAKYAWSGDPKTIGSGSEVIVESRPHDLVRSTLDLGGKACTVTFRVTPEADGSRVAWRLDFDLGANPAARYFGLFTDSLMGKDFEKGLARLKALAEKQPKADFGSLAIEEIETEPIPIAYVEASAPADEAAIGKAIGAAYAEIATFLRAHGLQQAGPPLTINTKWEDGASYEFDAALPIEGRATGDLGSGRVRLKSTYAGKALKVVHRGAYSGMRATYEKLFAYVEVRGLEPAGPPWDEYESDPGDTAEADLVTNIYLPIR